MELNHDSFKIKTDDGFEKKKKNSHVISHPQITVLSIKARSTNDSFVETESIFLLLKI